MGIKGVFKWGVVAMVLCSLSRGAVVRRHDPVDPEKRCHNTQADIIFILDESSSIYFSDFDLQKEFVNDVIDNFQIGPNKTRIAVMTFADKPQLIFNFDDYDTDVAVKKAVGDITQNLGNTMTNLALDMALEGIIISHMRQGVPLAAIVITDGQSDYPGRTAESARHLKAAGITVLAVGIGTNYSREELEHIASPPAGDHVFEVKSLNALKDLKDKLVWAACPNQYIEKCNSRQPLDVMFGLPEGVRIQETNKVFDFIRIVTDDLNISPVQVQAGLIPQLCNKTEGIWLRDNDDNPGFQTDLDSRRPVGEFTHNQLKFLLERAYLPENSRREEGEAVRTAVLVIDSDSQIPPETQAAADSLREKGIYLVVIGVGSDLGEAERTQLAFSPKYYQSVACYDDLPLVKKFITDRLCESIRETVLGGL